MYMRLNPVNFKRWKDVARIFPNEFFNTVPPILNMPFLSTENFPHLGSIFLNSHFFKNKTILLHNINIISRAPIIVQYASLSPTCARSEDRRLSGS
jgi:hypothetical protein